MNPITSEKDKLGFVGVGYTLTLSSQLSSQRLFQCILNGQGSSWILAHLELFGRQGVWWVAPRNYIYKEWVESHPQTVRRALTLDPHQPLSAMRKAPLERETK